MPTEPLQIEASVKDDPQDICSPKNDITTISNGEIGDCLLSDEDYQTKLEKNELMNR